MSETINGILHRFEPGASPDSPTLLLLHGTGGDENDLLGLGRSLAPQANLLSPRGPVSENGMPRFFRRFAEGIFDEQDIIFRAKQMADFLASAAKQYKFDATKIIALGYSNGANIAAAMLLLQPESLTGAILLRPMVPLVPQTLPDLTGKQILIVAGTADPMGSPKQINQLASMFQTSGATVQREDLPTSHGLTQDDLQIAHNWLRKIHFT
jgi:phospholipase/carboxylesterase